MHQRYHDSYFIFYPEERAVRSYETAANSCQTTRDHISDENNYPTSDTITAFFPLKKDSRSKSSLSLGPQVSPPETSGFHRREIELFGLLRCCTTGYVGGFLIDVSVNNCQLVLRNVLKE